MATSDTIYASDISGDWDLDSKGFLKVKTNSDAINDQIAFLFTTFQGEVLFKPSQGNSLEGELWEYADDIMALTSDLTDLLEQNIPYIQPQVSVYPDPNNPRSMIFDVHYTIKNDPNIGQVYTASGTM